MGVLPSLTLDFPSTCQLPIFVLGMRLPCGLLYSHTHVLQSCGLFADLPKFPMSLYENVHKEERETYSYTSVVLLCRPLLQILYWPSWDLMEPVCLRKWNPTSACLFSHGIKVMPSGFLASSRQTPTGSSTNMMAHPPWHQNSNCFICCLVSAVIER